MVKSCTRCVLDVKVPEIKFDNSGLCNYCKIYEYLEQQYPLNKNSDKKFREIVEKIKRDGKNKKYDCLIGVSGGADSTYILYVVKKLGLRPLALHLDNGWNSEIAVSNIERATNKLNIDLKTVVLDWEEFKDLQIAFLKASVPDVEIPTDHAIEAILYKVANEEGIKYIFQGHNFRTEGKIPINWGYGDARYIKSVYQLFGKNKRLRNFPLVTPAKLIYYNFIRRIKNVRILYYLGYNKSKIKELLEKELGWVDYGGKHHESTYTKFIQSYILPKKFNIDKRLVHYSAMICSNQITKKEAIKIIKQPPISDIEAKDLKAYVLKKLGLSEDEFEKIMKNRPKSFQDYPTYFQLIKKFIKPIKIVYSLTSPSLPPMLKLMDSSQEKKI